LGEIEEIGIDSFGIDLRRRSKDLCGLIAKSFYERDLSRKNEIKKKCGSITHGNFFRGTV
jgi:hypothetical protein